MGGGRNYLPNNLHEVDAKERKKKNDGRERGGGEGKETRDLSLSLPWIWEIVLSIGRFDGVALPRGRDDRESRLACLDLDPRPRAAGDSRGMRHAERVGDIHCQGQDSRGKMTDRMCCAVLCCAVLCCAVLIAVTSAWALEVRKYCGTQNVGCCTPIQVQLQQAVLQSCRRLPSSHFQGLRSIHFWRRPGGPCLQQKFAFHHSTWFPNCQRSG
jgi:hypothetical protein